MTARSRVPAIEGWFTLDEAEPKLIGTRGVDSGSYFWPPSLAVSANPNAPFEAREPVELSRTGRLWSYTTNHYAPPEPSVQTAPYTVCAVELEAEQIVVLGPLATEADPAQLRIGMPMELVLGPLYSDDEHEYVIYQWVPAPSIDGRIGPASGVEA